MLASVLELTREIGVRRAVGARKKDIRFQFLVTSFALSFLGGAAGVAIGVLIARVVAASASWPTVVTPGSILLSTGVFHNGRPRLRPLSRDSRGESQPHRRPTKRIGMLPRPRSRRSMTLALVAYAYAFACAFAEAAALAEEAAPYEPPDFIRDEPVLPERMARTAARPR